MSHDPEWLLWTRELQAIAQTGLTYSANPYDLDRYQQLRTLAAAIAAAHTGTPALTIQNLFAEQSGYPTPKIDVRGAVFNNRHEILMVREVADAGRWTLPGGWADVNLTPAACVVKEVREESGFEVRVNKVAAVWDRTKQGHASRIFSCWKTFFLCEIVGGSAALSLETSEVAWFSEQGLPSDLSLERVLPHQLHRMFEHARNPSLPTDFD